MAKKIKRQSFASRKRWLIILLIAGILIFLPMFSAAIDYSQSAENENKINSATTEQNSLAAAKKATAGKNKTEQKPPIQQKNEALTITVTEKDFLPGDIFIGIIEKKTINPRCVDINILLKSLPEAKEVDKEQKKGNQAKYWILLSHANDRMHKQIKEYTEAKEVTFLCKRDKLFVLLRGQDKYKEKSDQELIAAFDITDDIIDYFSEKNRDKKKQNSFYDID